ncbi:preprotein translocase subunit YajC [Acetobacteraceae bacterium ESL0709]|nr:preprotein translocase subunit YajC [Acetobacteraceae bacterium ESL0697]MDF7677717.1 preprotein translocase subunit YajC [Acetobacteraceae bacterium ESL0709]
MSTVFFSTAYAADQAGGGAFSTETLLQYGPIILIFVVFYFLLIRPQQTRQRQLREKQNGLRRGDKIVTAGGIVGVVQATREDSPEIDVEIAPNVRVKVVRSTITTVTPRDKPANDA